jgi:PGF-pre-PGF domain-containing protein
MGGTVSAVAPFSGTRLISETTVDAGDSFTVTITVNFNQLVEGPCINETLPSGWVVTQVDKQGATYNVNANSHEWIWATPAENGEQFILVYQVEVPSDEATGTYDIIGGVSGYDPDTSENIKLPIQGVGNIEIVGKSSSSTTSSVSSSSSGGGSGGSTTGEDFDNVLRKEVQSLYITKDNEVTYEFDADENAIDYVRFNPLKNSGTISATIEVLKGKSVFVDAGAPGTIYQYVNIWVGQTGFATSDNIAAPVIGFSVEKEWIAEMDILSSDISLYRYSDDDEWTKLDTSAVSEDDMYVYFESVTPGFSPFAISVSTSSDAITGSEVEDTDKLESVLDTPDEGIQDEDAMQDQTSSSIPGVGFTGTLFLMLSVGVLIALKGRK